MDAAVGRAGRSTRSRRREPGRRRAVRRAWRRSSRRRSTTGSSVSIPHRTSADSSKTGGGRQRRSGRVSSPRARRWSRTPRRPAARRAPRGQRGQLAERAKPPARQARGRLLRQDEQRQRGRGQIRGIAARLDDRHPRAEARGGERGDAALRDPPPDLHTHRRGGVAEPRGQVRLVAEEPFEPGRVEIDPAGAGVLHAGGMGERHLEQRGPRGSFPAGSCMVSRQAMRVIASSRVSRPSPHPALSPEGRG